MSDVAVNLSLLGIVLVVLLSPFLFRRLEENLEVFLFVMGALAATASGVWTLHLVEEALVEPIKITLAVLFAGLLFHYVGHRVIKRGVQAILKRVPLGLFVGFLVVSTGFASSVISAIIAALVLVEVVTALSLERRATVALTVVACLSIGIGAVMTPLGEPLSTIATAKLQGPPHNADFFFLARLLWPYVLPGVFGAGLVGAFLVPALAGKTEEVTTVEEASGLQEVLIRVVKVYVFVMALTLLGGGFKPIIDQYFVKVPPEGLYWANATSAILDNATVAAAEIGPALSTDQIQGALIAMLVAGVMLIPGNIPNIISAGKLRIGMKEWARVGVPLGAPVMLLYFLVLYLPTYL